MLTFKKIFIFYFAKFPFCCWKKSLSVDVKANEKVSFGVGYENRKSDGYANGYEYTGKPSELDEGKTYDAVADKDVPKNSAGKYVLGYRGDKEYENETVDFIKFPNGTYLSTRSEEYYDKYLVKDGKVYERSWGQLKQPKSTKRTKRMKVIKDEPLNKHYKTFENFLKAECQDSFCEKENSYGYYCNSCAYYDWFLIGGRWPKCFLVKDTCTEYSIGDRSTDKDELVAPKGYKWVVAARKKDIEWEVIRNWHIEKSTNEYHECVRLYGLEEIPKESDYRKNEKGITWWGEQIYLAGDTLEDFLKRHCVSDKIKYDFSPFAYYEGEEYFDKYCLPRSEDKGDYDNAWQNVIDKFIDGLSDDTVLVGVDCHM